MDKLKTFNKICREIQSVKIQGASELAKKAFYAYKLIPAQSSKRKLLSLRPTEPMLRNILERFDNLSYEDLIKKLNKNQEAINKEVCRLIRHNDIIFTHCHASTIIKALIYCKKKGKKFQVYNTETRPLYQGRKTSEELRKAKIPVTMFTDSAVLTALINSGKQKRVDLILLGADAITKKGVINKIGSGMYAELARLHRIPFYIVSDSLKFSKNKIKIEKRNPFEIWHKHDLKIQNPAFEFIKKKLISGVISELGTLRFKEFVKRARRN